MHQIAFKNQDILMLEHFVNPTLNPARSYSFKTNEANMNLLQAFNGNIVHIDIASKDGTRTILNKLENGMVSKTTIPQVGAPQTTIESAESIDSFSSFLSNDRGIEAGVAKTGDNAITQALQDLPAEEIAQKALDDTEIAKILSRFDNVENLKKHLSSKADAEKRQSLFGLLDSTMEKPHIEYKKDTKSKYLKKFKNNTNDKDPYFYLLVTKDKDKTFITHFKSRDYRYFQKELQEADEIVKGADIIGDFRQQAGSSQKAIESPTSENHSTPQPLNETLESNNFFTTKVFAESLQSRSLKVRLNDNLLALRALGELANGKTLSASLQEALARYSGFGGLKFAGVEAEIRSLLEPIANNEAIVRNTFLGQNVVELPHKIEILANKIFANSDNSYYTPHSVIAAVYEHLDFVNGRVLESSMGIGNFYTAMPRKLFNRVQKVGVELDPISAAIAKHLNADVSVQAKSFFDFEDSVGFDLVIGNPPYGEKILQEFISKAVAHSKENGLIVQVVSSSFLDNKASLAVRAKLAKEVELLGAVRLPSNTFSGTDLATDIIVLQKRSGKDNSTSWVQAREFNDSELLLNDYYHTNPQNVLGELKKTSTQFGFRWRVDSVDEIDKVLRERLGEILKRRENESDAVFAEAQRIAVQSFFAPVQKQGSLNLVGDTIVQFDRGELKPVNWLERVRGNGAEFESLSFAAKTRRKKQALKAESIAKDYIPLKNALEAVRGLEILQGVSESELKVARDSLNHAYHQFVKNHGKVSSNKLLKKALSDEPSLNSVMDLDLRGQHTILTSRTRYPYQIPSKANNLNDAISISKSYAGKISAEFVSELLNDKYAIHKALENGELFADSLGNLYTKQEFVVGDLGARIDGLKALGMLDSVQKKALELLESSLPEPLKLKDIYYHPSSSFIPQEVMLDFFESLGVKAEISPLTKAYILDPNSGSFGFNNDYQAVSAKMSHSAIEVLESLLNNKPLSWKKQVQGIKTSYPEQFAANKLAQQKLLETFYTFMQKNHSKSIEQSYNHQFRRMVALDYQATPILHGANPDIKLYLHQNSAIAFALNQKNVLLDHSVGAGKTYEMIAIAMEYNRLAIAKNPLFVVPNHLVEQWAQSFSHFHPNANILRVPNNELERKRALGMLANGMQFDAVIMPHSTFDSLQLSPKTLSKYLYEDIKELDTLEKIYHKEQLKESQQSKHLQKAEKRFLVSLAKKKLKLQEKLNALLNSKAAKEQSVMFDELGFDALFVDEAHLYKNLGFISTNRNIRGLGNEVGSQRAQNLLYKVKTLQEKDQRIVFATGTPLVSSISEVYTWQRYLSPQILKDKNIGTFDRWLNVYGSVSSELERTPVGTYKDNERLRGFKNIGELSTLYRQFAHYVDVSQTHIKRPNVEEIKIQCESSPQQKQYMQHLLERYVALSKGEPLKGFENDNFLNITTDGIKSALDYRLIDKAAEDFSNSKINRAVFEMTKLYNATNDVRGTQLVFIDRSTPKAKRGIRDEIKNAFEEYDRANDDTIEQALYEKLQTLATKHHYENIDIMRESITSDFSLYDDMREKLIQAGIPKEQIAFIHDYTTDVTKAELFKKVNAGEIRFLFGSTQKMGAGMNVQERIVGLHHIDAAWNPADIEQRDGRGIRQGNKLLEADPNFRIKIFRYVTEGSCDSVYYTKLEQKANSIKNFRAGSADKEYSDETIITLEELKALATGDERELTKAKLNKDLQEVQYQLKALKSANEHQEYNKQHLTKSLAILPKEIERLKLDLKSAKPQNTRKLSEEETQQLKNLEMIPDSKEPLFELDNYQVFLEQSPRGKYSLSAISENGNEITLLSQSDKAPEKITHYARKLIDESSKEKIQSRITQTQTELEKAKEQLNAIEQSKAGKEIAKLETKEQQISEQIHQLIQEMSANAQKASRKKVDDEINEVGEIEQALMDNETFQRRLNNIPKDKQQAYLRHYSEQIATKFPNHDSQTAIDAHILIGEILENYAWMRKNKADASAQPLRQELETLLNIQPTKEFGTNYAEFYHNGAGAIQKLLAEAKDFKARGEKGEFSGQVAGAFYRKDLQELSGNGEIDLVWGEVTDATKHKGYGLAHIRDKHPELDVNLIPEIVEKGELVDLGNGKIRIVTDNYTIGMKKEWKGKPTNAYILTAFENTKESAKNLHSSTFTKGETLPSNSQTNPTTPNIKEGLENDDTTLVQQIQDKFKFDEPKAKALAQWHKDSSPITKDEQGLPKVFYYLAQAKSSSGDSVAFDVFGRKSRLKGMPSIAGKAIDDLSYGILFYTNKDDAKLFKNLSKTYEVFLNIKKPLDIDTIITKQNMAEFEQLFKRNNEPKNLKANIAEFENKPLITYLKHKGFEQYPQQSLMRKNEKGVNGVINFNNLADFLSLKGYDAIIQTQQEKPSVYVFNPNQIKSIDNKGSFDSSNNIYQTNPHVGSGVITGTLAGLETDEQGNMSFNPEKFALGFLGGAVGSKAISSALQHLSKNPQHKEAFVKTIAEILDKGLPATIAKYPLLEIVAPKKISDSLQGKIAQANNMISKLEQKEKRGLFNVVYNGKNATKVYKDLENVDSAIRFAKGNKNKGGTHIRLKHTIDTTQEGYVKPQEVANLGKSLREFLGKNEPFVDSNGARIYEWESGDKVRFRLVVNDTKREADSNPAQLPKPFSEEIITFYSDRNLKNPMIFKNPKLKGE